MYRQILVQGHIPSRQFIIISMTDIGLQTLANASVGIERDTFLITPMEEIRTARAIKDVRGYGVPHAVFFDTSDKTVVFPRHIPGYQRKFESGLFALSARTGWTHECTKQQMHEARIILKDLAHRLNSNGTKAQVIYARGHHEGHLQAVHFEDDKSGDVNLEGDLHLYDMALWIWSARDNLTALLKTDQKPKA